MRPLSYSYIRLLLRDEMTSRRKVKELKKDLRELKGNIVRNLIDLYYEKRDLENIEAEIKSLTDTAFFTSNRPLCVEDILNDNGNESTQQIPGDRN